MEKKYKIKEEVKKYFNQNIWNTKKELIEWENDGILIEALEEVDERIEVKITERQMGRDINYYPFYLSKSGYLKWTEQERELIEFVVNNFDSLEMLNELVWDYKRVVRNTDFGDKIYKFTDWLKQRKH